VHTSAGDSLEQQPPDANAVDSGIKHVSLTSYNFVSILDEHDEKQRAVKMSGIDNSASLGNAARSVASLASDKARSRSQAAFRDQLYNRKSSKNEESLNSSLQSLQKHCRGSMTALWQRLPHQGHMDRNKTK